MADICLLEDSHRYLVDGQEYPSVTTVLKPLYDFSCVGEETLEHARRRGSIVHKLCELDDLGTLDEDSIDSSLAPYLHAWRRFRSESGFEPVQIEWRLANKQFRYGGTLDRTGRMKDSMSTMLDLFDIKTSACLGPEIGPQLAAYQRAINVAGVPKWIHRRYAVQLRSNGKYSLKEYSDLSDFATFAACLQIYSWREKHGRKHREFS